MTDPNQVISLSGLVVLGALMLGFSVANAVRDSDWWVLARGIANSKAPGSLASCEVSAVAEVLMWTVVVVVTLLAWVPVVRDLRDEFHAYSSESVRRAQRSARHVADAYWSRVGGGRPETASRFGAPTGRHRATRVATGRSMSSAGAVWRVTVPADGPSTRHGRPVCG